MTTPPYLAGSETESSAVRGQLKWLAISYYVWGGFCALTSAILLIFVVAFGALGAAHPSEFTYSKTIEASGSAETTVTTSTESGVTTETETTSSSDSAPAVSESHAVSEEDAKAASAVFKAMAGFFVVILLVCWVICALIIYAGRCVQKRKHRVFVIVMGCLNLLSVPFGTALGIFTLIALNSEGAKREFGQA